DGWGGPWQSADESCEESFSWLRAVAADHAALLPAPASGPDPRAAHGLPGQTTRSLAERAARSLAGLSLPVLTISTPADPLPPAESAELATLADPTDQDVRHETANSSPAAVAAAVTCWWPTRSVKP